MTLSFLSSKKKKKKNIYNSSLKQRNQITELYINEILVSIIDITWIGNLLNKQYNFKLFFNKIIFQYTCVIYNAQINAIFN